MNPVALVAAALLAAPAQAEPERLVVEVLTVIPCAELRAAYGAEDRTPRQQQIADTLTALAAGIGLGKTGAASTAFTETMLEALVRFMAQCTLHPEMKGLQALGY